MQIYLIVPSGTLQELGTATSAETASQERMIKRTLPVWENFDLSFH